jgi:hypothetical protein
MAQLVRGRAGALGGANRTIGDRGRKDLAVGDGGERGESTGILAHRVLGEDPGRNSAGTGRRWAAGRLGIDQAAVGSVDLVQGRALRVAGARAEIDELRVVARALVDDLDPSHAGGPTTQRLRPDHSLFVERRRGVHQLGRDVLRQAIGALPRPQRELRGAAAARDLRLTVEEPRGHDVHQRAGGQPRGSGDAALAVGHVLDAVHDHARSGHRGPGLPGHDRERRRGWG